jgi:hypothetical protein
MYVLSLECDASYFSDSVFDCELVAACDGSHVLLVFDACVIQGDAAVGQEPLPSRLDDIAYVFPGVVTATDTDAATVSAAHIRSATRGLVLAAKPMTRLRDFKTLKKEGGSLYETDGYILTPERDPAPGPGVASAIFKVKTLHTLDLLWVAGDLYLGSMDHLVSVTTMGEAGVPPVRVDAPTFADVPAYSVVEVSPEVEEASSGRITLRLRLLRVREDRSSPNHMKCVVSTLRSVVDCVTIDDVVASTNLCI